MQDTKSYKDNYSYGKHNCTRRDVTKENKLSYKKRECKIQQNIKNDRKYEQTTSKYKEKYIYNYGEWQRY